MTTSPGRSEGEREGHADCAGTMYRLANLLPSMADLPGEMAVSFSEPEIVADEFPPQVYRCPHGVRLYAYPTPLRIAALRALNGVN